MERRADAVLKSIRQSMSSDKDLLMMQVTRWKEIEETMHHLQIEVMQMVHDKDEAMEVLKGQNSDLNNLLMRFDIEDMVKGQ